MIILELILVISLSFSAGALFMSWWISLSKEEHETQKTVTGGRMYDDIKNCIRIVDHAFWVGNPSQEEKEAWHEIKECLNRWIKKEGECTKT